MKVIYISQAQLLLLESQKIHIKSKKFTIKYLIKSIKCISKIKLNIFMIKN